ncbi:MAG TPA: Crp/Fnr family transcriptional regulator [Acidobacteriaceae bacterium]
MQAYPFRNKILNHLDSEVIDRLQLKPVELPARRVIETPGEPIRELIFIEDGIGSMTNTFADGFQVEVGMFGYESVMGASALIGTKRSLNKVYMQMAGVGFACPMGAGIAEFHRGEHFHDLVLRYVQAQLVQTAQSAGCNAHHDIVQRLSRWLCLCDDRSRVSPMNLTQEFLADMLGTNRPTVTTAAGILQDRSLIEYNRGKIVILDRAALEAQACECYEVVKQHLDNYIEVEQD